MVDDPNGTFLKVPELGCRPVDLLKSIQDVDLSLVKDCSSFLIQAGHYYLVENLSWSGEEDRQQPLSE